MEKNVSAVDPARASEVLAEVAKYRYGIGFSLWLTCNAQCAHCCTNSSPHSKEMLDLEVAKRCLTEAADLGVRSYQVTGGEPTVFMPKLLDFFRHGQQLGMSGAITSNGYFADTEARCRKVLTSLVDLGLATLRLSTDTYHEPYIPFERVLRAMDVALDMGIETSIEVTIVRRDARQAEVFEAINRYVARGVRLYTSGTLPTGTANGLPDEVFLTRSVSEMRNLGCAQAKSLFIDTDGRAYFCCNFPRPAPGAEPLDTSLYNVGNVYEHSIHQIYYNMATSPISARLSETGPDGVLQALRADHGDELIDRLHQPKLRYCGICDFCYSVISNPGLVPLAARSLGTEGHPDYGSDPEAVIAAKEHALALRPVRSSALRVVG
jgi:MoaA/NifB/PqqE/SkfB family radical SAM enzyme